MKLPVPSEPVKLKREARRNPYGLKLNHKLQSYLWKEGQWSEIFKREECNWPCFLKVYSWLGKEVDDWVMDEISWKDLINKFENFTQEYLFNIDADAELEDDLNKSIIPEKLKVIFRTKGVPLSDNANVTKEKENEWVITDEIKFFIRKGDGKRLWWRFLAIFITKPGKLNIFREGKIFGPLIRELNRSNK